MSLLTYLSGYEGTLNDKTMSWLRTRSPWMSNGTLEDLWMSFLQGYQGSLNDRMLAWARETSGLSEGSLNDALLGLPDGGAQYVGASLGLYFDEDKYESGAAGAKPIDKPFADIITFTRASGGGRFNASGNYEYLGDDVPRLDYDPVTLQPRGILIEEQRTNLLTYSSDFADAAWGKSKATVTTYSGRSPDGGMTAVKLAANSATDAHYTSRSPYFTAGQSYTLSIFAKAAEYPAMQLVFTDATFGTNIFATFDLVNGISASTGGGTAVSTSITSAGGGFYRCSVTATATATANSIIQVRVLNSYSPFDYAYAGDGTSGIYIWGAQLEAGAFPTSYIPTVASQVTRSGDVASVNTLSPWYNAQEGTLFLDVVNRTKNTSIGTFVLSLGSSDTEYMGLGYASLSTASKSSYVAAGGGSTSFSGSVMNIGDSGKIALSYSAAGVFQVAVDGVAQANKALPAARPPVISSMRIGRGHFGGATVSCHIKAIRYFPRALTSDELQRITS